MSTYIVVDDKKLYMQCIKCDQEIRQNKCKIAGNCIRCNQIVNENTDMYCCEFNQCSSKNKPICETCYLEKLTKFQANANLPMSMLPKKMRQSEELSYYSVIFDRAFFLCVLPND